MAGRGCRSWPAPQVLGGSPRPPWALARAAGCSPTEALPFNGRQSTSASQSCGDPSASSFLMKMADESIPVWAATVLGFVPKPIHSPVTTRSGLFQGGRAPTAFSLRPLVPDERPGPSLLSEAPRIDRVSLSGSSPPFRQCRCFCCFCFKHLLFWLSRIQARASPYRFGCRLSPGPASVRCLPKSRAVGGGDSVDRGDSASG